MLYKTKGEARLNLGYAEPLVKLAVANMVLIDEDYRHYSYPAGFYYTLKSIADELDNTSIKLLGVVD
jgi:hypothetical protein